MCLQPKNASRRARIDTALLPPHGFVTAAMNFAVMSSAKRNRELIADFAAKRPRLRKTEMMHVGGTPAANQAWLLGDRFHMLAVADPAQHGQRQDRFVDTRCPISPSAAPSQRFGLLRDCWLVG